MGVCLIYYWYLLFLSSFKILDVDAQEGRKSFDLDQLVT